MDFDKLTKEEQNLYSEIEYMIIEWNIDGSQTAGSLTREIMEKIEEYNKKNKKHER